MRHIDDGALHAYLDGAHDLIGAPGGVDALVTHLSECAACRARLEAERAVRDRAAAILGMGAPLATELPPFTALERRRGLAAAGAGAGAAAVGDSGNGEDKRDAGTAGGSARRPGVWRRMPLAWAATIVLAVGAGWIAREMIETPGGERVSAVTAGEPQAERAGAMRTGEDVASPPTPGGGRETGPSRPGAGTLEATSTARPRSDRASTDPAVAAAGDRPQLARVDERQEVSAPAVPPLAAFESRTADLPRARPGGLRAGVTAGEMAAAERERERREERSVVIGEPVDDSRYLRAAAPPPPAPRSPPPPPPAPESQPIALQEVLVTGLTGPEEPLWRPVERRVAEAALGRPILIVSDLPIVAIEVPASGPATTIRIRQRLDTGGVLTLQQSLERTPVGRSRDAAAAAAPTRAAHPEQLAVQSADRPALIEVEAREEPGEARLELRQGDLVIHARAPVPLGRLRALLERLR